MTEKVEDRSFGESLESERTEDEVSNFGNSRTKYTRALLLRFKDCRKLPGDFNVLILRELNGESDGTIDKNAGQYSLSRATWNWGVPGERWDSHLLILDKENNFRRTCSLEGRNVASQQLTRDDSYGAAGVLGQKPPKSDLSQLKKAENPYRPPHCSKKMLQPSANISEPGKEASLGSDQRTPADSITENEKYGHDIPLVGVDLSTKELIGDCDDSWKNTEENEVFVANETINKIIEEVLEDNQLTFDDLSAEILKTIHFFQQESSISSTDSEDEDSLISIAPKNSMPTLHPEAEINLPDEDSLISIYDLIGPESLMAIRYSEPNKATSNKMRNKSESPFEFPLLNTQRKLHTPTFGPEKPSHLNVPPMQMIANISPCYMTSYSVLQQPSISPHTTQVAEWNVHRFSALPPEQSATSYHGFRSLNAGGFRNEEASGFSLWHTQF